MLVSTDKTVREGEGKDLKQFHFYHTSQLLKKEKRDTGVIHNASYLLE